MTIATPERYAEMLDAARRGGYAYPAINVSSSQTLNAALKGFADAESDGIIQVSVGAAAYLSGIGVNDRVTGSLALAAFAHEVAAKYPNITIALHTDHCAKQYLDEWVRPLLAHEADQVAHGQEPTFQSHMWDGSTVPLKENLDIAEELLDKSQAAHTVLEIEIGAVGGEEDGYSAKIDERSIPRRPMALKWPVALVWASVADTWPPSRSVMCTAPTSPASVKLRPALLRWTIQSRVARAVVEGELPSAAGIVDFPNGKPFELVFHGGSGSRPEEIAEAVSHGVIKMNIDTDTQYSFTRPIADHVFENYDKVLKIDGEVGEKKFYDPRSWGRKAEESMSARVAEACKQLGSAGKALR